MSKARLCSIQDCGKLHEAKGFCRSHYMRLRAHGDPPWAWINQGSSEAEGREE